MILLHGLSLVEACSHGLVFMLIAGSGLFAMRASRGLYCHLSHSSAAGWSGTLLSMPIFRACLLPSISLSFATVFVWKDVYRSSICDSMCDPATRVGGGSRAASL